MVIDVQKSIKKLEKRTLSYSKMKSILSCSARLMERVVFEPPIPYQRDDTISCCGTLLHHLTDCIIKHKLWVKAGSKEWLRYQLEGLYTASLATLEDGRTVDYVESVKAATRRYETQSDYPELHPFFLSNPIAIHVDEEGSEYKKRWKDRETLLRNMTDHLTQLHRVWHENRVPFDKLLSEVHFEVPYRGYSLNGYVDLLVNKEPITKLEELEDGFIIVENKYSSHPITVEAGIRQLHFYVYCLQMLTGKVAKAIGLYIFQDGKFIWCPLRNKDVRIAEKNTNDTLDIMESTLRGLYNANGVIELGERPLFPLQYEPSKQNCRFCSLLPLCPQAVE